MITVLIVDDISLFRRGIQTIIEQDEDIKVIGCVGNGKEALELCEKYNPDVVLMDIKMPIMDGIEATRRIKEMDGSIKVLILTTFVETEDIFCALKYGADGYVLKDLEQEQLVGVIKNIHHGFSIFDKNIMNSVRCQYDGNRESGAISFKKPLKFGLTERELEIIQYIIQGKKNKDIAAAAHITEGSVKNMTSKILKKLNLEDRTQLAIFAVKNGLI